MATVFKRRIEVADAVVEEEESHFSGSSTTTSRIDRTELRLELEAAPTNKWFIDESELETGRACLGLHKTGDRYEHPSTHDRTRRLHALHAKKSRL